MKQTRYPMFVTTVLIVLVLSAMRAIPALADDSIPPVPTDIPVVIDTPVVEEQSVPSLPVAIPEGTEPVVTSVEEENVPLASTDAADDSMINGDPMWCPTGVAPKAGTGGCSPTFDHFGFATDSSSLIHWLVHNQQNKAGTIWVEYNYLDSTFETTPSIVIDSNDYTSMDNFALTIQGGWSGTPSSKALYIADPYSYFEYSTLAITNWTGAVTVNNLVFDTSSFVAAYDSALSVSTKGNIKLTNVIAQNNTNTNVSFSRTGIVLNNNIGTAGTITLLNVTSTFNEGDGLDIYARGAITATNTIVENNGDWGAYINNTFAFTDQPVTLKGFQQFNDNGDKGLAIYSNGLVTLGNLAATGNGADGVWVDNTTSLTSKGVTISGSNLFFQNNSVGLIVLSKGNISLSNATSIENGGIGILLDNCFYNGTGCSGKGSINVSGVNIANQNGGVGIAVGSFGSITVSNLTANSNGPSDSGARLSNLTCNFDCSVYSKAPITLLGYGTFLYNNSNAFFSDPGLFIYSNGTVTTNNLTASVNGGIGALLAGNMVVVKGVNVFNYNNRFGLQVIAQKGITTVSNVTANGNGDDGVNILNLGLGVLLSGVNTAINSIGSNGFYIDTAGFATVNNITASGNGDYGLYIEADGAITINNITANNNSNAGVFLANDISTSKPVNVTLNGFNTFSENSDGGIEIFSYGAVLINNATANNNFGYHGIYVNNQNFFIAKPVTFTGFVVANANYYDGVNILTDGLVTMSNVNASQNLDEGVNIDNSQVATRQNGVTLLGSSFFNSNNNNGLYVTSYGTITLNNVTAIDNGYPGVMSYGTFLNNTGGLLAKNVTLTGVNNFNLNYDQGLWIYTDGAATLNRINADHNDWDNANDGYQGDGVVVYAGGNITLTCSHMVGNVGVGFGYGYVLTSYNGAIFLKGVYSHYNGSSSDYTNVTPVITACALP